MLVCVVLVWMLLWAFGGDTCRAEPQCLNNTITQKNPASGAALGGWHKQEAVSVSGCTLSGATHPASSLEHTQLHNSNSTQMRSHFHRHVCTTPQPQLVSSGSPCSRSTCTHRPRRRDQHATVTAARKQQQQPTQTDTNSKKQYDLLALSNLCVDVVVNVPSLPGTDEQERLRMLHEVRKPVNMAPPTAVAFHKPTAQQHVLCDVLCLCS